jgi:hypothetical protein
MVFHEADLEVVNSGTFLEDDLGNWSMDGTFEVVVSTDPEFESDDCTITGPMNATQISEL